MSAAFSLFYGSAVYFIFLGTFLYAIAFVANLPVGKTIDNGDAAPLAEALVMNLILLSVFAVQHSVMARPAFKRWWTKWVPQAVERSTFVLFASAALLLLYWQWRPITQNIWTVDGPAAMVLWGVSALGWVTVLVSTFLINHFELFGLRQVYSRWTGTPIPEMSFKTPVLYKHVRHPIYLGFIMAFWATPVMSAGHLLFAVMTTGYILVGIWFEERDLIAQFGEQYRSYKRSVGMLLPKFGAKSPAKAPAEAPPAAE